MQKATLLMHQGLPMAWVPSIADFLKAAPRHFENGALATLCSGGGGIINIKE